MKSFTQFQRAAGITLLILAFFLCSGTGIKSAFAQTFEATGLPQGIPDGSSGTCWESPGTPLTSTIPITGVHGNITSLDQITVNIILYHTWVGDIKVSITPPGGSPVYLISRLGTSICGSSVDFSSSNLLSFNGSNTASVPLNNPVPAGNYLPTAGTYGGTPGNMADLIGYPFNGDWVLTVVDGTVSDIGRLHFFSIEVPAKVINQTQQSEFQLISDAIAAANSGDTLLISESTYDESVNTSGKNLTLIPGNSSGTITITGSLTLGSGDTLDMEIFDADDFDKFIVQGAVSLGDALLKLSIPGNYEPTPGATFQIIDYGSLDGEFSNKSFVAIDNDNSFAIDYNGPVGTVLLTNVRRFFKLDINTIGP